MSQRELTAAKEFAAKQHSDYLDSLESFKFLFPLSEETKHEILELDLSSLINAQKILKYKATEILCSYVDKALEVNKEINAVISFFPEAFEAAKDLDNLCEEKKKTMALFGIPFSVKQNFFMKGYASNLGFIRDWNKVSEDTCSFVKLLEHHGGIPFCFTNVPQGLISYVCSNPLYGTTENPKRKGFTPGGSSGGEAALLAGNGSPFGIGSDLAGSLRIPASMCGVVSLKPMQSRIVALNAHRGMPGKSGLVLAYGFFTKSADEQLTLWQIIMGDDYYHTQVPLSIPGPMKFYDYEEFKKTKLTVGYYESCGFINPVPSNKRMVTETIGKLREAGYNVVPFELPNGNELARMVFNAVLSDNGQFLYDMYRGDLADAYLTKFVTLLGIPTVAKRIGSFALKNVSEQFSVMASCGTADTTSLRLNQAAIEELGISLTQQFVDKQIDFLVCPQFPIPSIPHQFPSELGAAAVDTALWNLVDCPAGIVTLDKVNQKDIEELADYNKDRFNFLLNKIVEASKDTLGNPIGVQVVSPPYGEAKCLLAMKLIEELWNVHE
uniref:Amidase domain-containing protein n=1 Tax=Rhabditophanes sp. KR3021 TaxID=114890 RepID=A0AC35U096_9BILA